MRCLKDLRLLLARTTKQGQRYRNYGFTIQQYNDTTRPQFKTINTFVFPQVRDLNKEQR